MGGKEGGGPAGCRLYAKGYQISIDLAASAQLSLPPLVTIEHPTNHATDRHIGIIPLSYEIWKIGGRGGDAEFVLKKIEPKFPSKPETAVNKAKSCFSQ